MRYIKAYGNLMKARNMRMSAVQTIVSLLLNAGHTSSLVGESCVCFNSFMPTVIILIEG